MEGSETLDFTNQWTTASVSIVYYSHTSLNRIYIQVELQVVVVL